MLYYFTFGIGFYIGLALKNPKSFVNANSAAIIRGLLLGVVFWPIGVILETWAAIYRLGD
jgi:hypothetical protein